MQTLKKKTQSVCAVQTAVEERKETFLIGVVELTSAREVRVELVTIEVLRPTRELMLMPLGKLCERNLINQSCLSVITSLIWVHGTGWSKWTASKWQLSQNWLLATSLIITRATLVVLLQHRWTWSRACTTLYSAHWSVGQSKSV